MKSTVKYMFGYFFFSSCVLLILAPKFSLIFLVSAPQTGISSSFLLLHLCVFTYFEGSLPVYVLWFQGSVFVYKHLEEVLFFRSFSIVFCSPASLLVVAAGQLVAGGRVLRGLVVPPWSRSQTLPHQVDTSCQLSGATRLLMCRRHNLSSGFV